MYKKTFVLFLLVFFLALPDVFSQFNIENPPSAPWLSPERRVYKDSPYMNPNTVGYAYNMLSSGSRFFRFNVGSPNLPTLIGNSTNHTFANGDFANPTGVWKFYVQEQLNYPYVIYSVDTATGILDSLGPTLNLRSGHKPKDMEWDPTTNTMYIISTNNAYTETQLYSMNWPSKYLTWIGPLSTSPAAITAGGFNANGTYFGCDMGTNALWKVNKFTGDWTYVGPLGIGVGLYQDAGFDKSDYSKMLFTGNFQTISLYEVDTATGGTTLIGPFPIEYLTVMGMGFMSTPGPQIVHTPLQNTTNEAGPYAVNAVITSTGTGISSAKVYWSRNNPSITDSVTMTRTNGNNWTGNIPGNNSIAIYRYYIRTKDSLNRSVASPYNAPSVIYTFAANANDTAKPIISPSPHGNIYKYQWPDTVIASVTDNIGIDSVWVRWRINSNNSKNLKLINKSGNIYRSMFNSLITDVNIGDTVYYRIIAQDNSFNHNRDSSSLLSFNIIFSSYTCIGNGTATLQSPSPFYTYFRGYKTQMLWTASEISANGGIAGNITQIGFKVITLDPIPINNFNVKMQNSSLTQLINGFINSDWTTVYSGTYAVPGTGWQFIVLQTPFYWDGISSILIEFCFNNNVSSSGTYVQGTAISSMEYYAYHYNDTLGCSTVQNPLATTYRPNVCFYLVPVIGVSNNTNNIPSEYKLFQNYPNPFNPVTKINYGLPKKGFVSLKVFDILGRMVADLVNENKSPGYYTIDFNASGLPSGTYLYRLECNGCIETKRMILIK